MNKEQLKHKRSVTISVEDSFGCMVNVTIISDDQLNPASISEYIKKNWPGTESWEILARSNVIEAV